MDKTTYKFADQSIAWIMQLLQLSLMTGTPIDDHLRLAEFEETPEGLVMTEDFISRTEKFVTDLEQNLQGPILDEYEQLRNPN